MLAVRRDLNQLSPWKLMQNASNDGSPMLGSRLRYEMDHWRYPAPKGGEEAQKQDPSDDTADGADMIAALRYAVMSHWHTKKKKRKEKGPDPNVDTGLEEYSRRLKRHSGFDAA